MKILYSDFPHLCQAPKVRIKYETVYNKGNKGLAIELIDGTKILIGTELELILKNQGITPFTYIKRRIA